MQTMYMPSNACERRLTFGSPVARYSNTLGREDTTELSADVVNVGDPALLLEMVKAMAAIDGGSGSTDEEEEEEVVGGGVFDGLAFTLKKPSKVHLLR